MGRDRPAAFTDEGGNRNIGLLTGFLDGSHNIIGVILHIVVFRGIEIRMGTIVIYRQTTTDIEIAHFRPHFDQLNINLAGFAHRFFNEGDIRNLGTDMEMQ